MKVYVDSDFCGGTGLCVDTCPEVFGLTDNGTATVSVDEVPLEFHKACRQAADNCPTNAITVEE